MEEILRFITNIRNVRAQWNIQNSAEIKCLVETKDKAQKELLEKNKAFIQRLARLEEILFVEKIQKPKEMATGIAGKIKFFIPLEGLLDIEKEKNRIAQELETITSSCQNLLQRLKNKEFLKKAPKDVIEKEEGRLKDFALKKAELEKALKDLS